MSERGSRDSARSQRAGSERGAGSVLALGIVGAVAATAVAVAPVLGAHVASRRAANAADAAALAAADVLSGAVPGIACDLAAATAARNGASLASCEVAGLEASVSVEVAWPLGAITASARAGPPPEGAPPDG
ncbi:Rv3654c family TadE-like protein [Agromyces soli]